MGATMLCGVALPEWKENANCYYSKLMVYDIEQKMEITATGQANGKRMESTIYHAQISGR